jgi:hypothetical protein
MSAIPGLEAEEITCEGPWAGVAIVCFTDRCLESPSYGASFDVAEPIDLSKVVAARDAKRAQFARANRSPA